MRYEYKVVPAPSKPRKAPKIKGAEAKFAFGLEATMNEYAADGWEYQRADILPSEERRGLRSTQTVYRTVLVFRRLVSEGVETHDRSETSAAPHVLTPEVDPEPLKTVEVEAEPKRSARFSLVGSARRGEDRKTPPLSSAHVSDEAPDETEPSDTPR